MEYPEVKIEVFAPEHVITAIREAVNDANAGHIGDYDHCVSITEVKGYWRPLTGANPYDGEIGKISTGTECKLEVNCKAEFVQNAIQAIRRVHPYEEPLINIVPLLNHLYD